MENSQKHKVAKGHRTVPFMVSHFCMRHFNTATCCILKEGLEPHFVSEHFYIAKNPRDVNKVVELNGR